MTVLLAISVLISAILLVPLAVVLMNVAGWRRVYPLAGQRLPAQVSVLVPARNEAHNLPECIAAIRRQGPVVEEIIVLDDRSSDGTQQVVQNAMKEEVRLRLLTGQRLVDGWAGKCWACQQLGDAAAGKWLLFVDADTRLMDGAINGMLSAALLMPLLNFLTFTLYPAPLAVLRPDDASLGLAHGACLLVSREDYLALGGHECVRQELFEDTRLARAWRASGRRGLCLDGQDVVRVRMYQSLSEIWLGFEKNFYPAFRHWLPFVAFLITHIMLFLVPFALATHALLTGQPVPVLLLALAASTTVVVMRLLLGAHFRHPLWSALLHPLGELFLIAIALNSWWRVASGRGVRWKGRSYLGVRGSTKERQP